MGGNRGFKGVDKREYIDPTNSGRGGSEGHLFERNRGLSGARSPGYETYQLKADDWTRAGWSASFSEDSGSKLFHSPDTVYGADWSTRNIWSNVTIKCDDWVDSTEKAIISFRIGNCLNGNANGSYFGSGGCSTFSDIYKSTNVIVATNATPGEGPMRHSQTRVSWYADAADRLVWYWYGTSGGTLTSLSEGDLIEVKWTIAGSISIWHNGAIFVTYTYNEKYSNNAPNDHEYMTVMQSKQEGASGNYAFYDFKFSGVITKYPDGIGYMKFNTQFDQTMLPISTSGWESGSYTGNLPQMVTNADSGSCVTYHGGNYTTPIWSNQFITGSGRGGIYTMTTPSASTAFPISNIAAITDHSLVTGYNYFTHVLNWTGVAKTWGSDTSGSAFSRQTWYQYSTTGAGLQTKGINSGLLPMAPGSKIAFIITGSHPSNREIFGGRKWNYGTTTADGAQTVAMFIKCVDTTGAAINDYLSGNWMLAQFGIYEASGKGQAPKKLVFNRGTAGDHLCHIEIGDNYIASGSF